MAPALMRAQAPEQLSAGVYEVTVRAFRGGAMGDVEQTWLYVLSEDGACAPVFGGAPATWSYEKTGTRTAVLTRVQREGAVGETSLRDELVFEGPTSGAWTSVTEDGGRSTQAVRRFQLHAFSGRSRLANVSCRAFVRAGERAHVGFVIRQSGSLVLVRAVGPGLRAFGVASSMAAPVLTVPGLGENRGWSTPEVSRPGLVSIPEERHRVRGLTQFFGAFPLAEGGGDSAVQGMLSAGNYVAEVTSGDAETGGEVLVEVYVFP
jgi:hypothetical protein